MEFQTQQKGQIPKQKHNDHASKTGTGAQQLEPAAGAAAQASHPA
jgi:hypothetical protein